MRVAVFASGGGTNLQTLLDSCRPPEAARIVLVASDEPAAGALDRARAAGVATHVIPDPGDGNAIVEVLRDVETDLVVLARYLKPVALGVVRAFEGRIINIHPALLPAFGGKGMHGAHVHRAVIESGATVSGVTVHLVNEAFDRGKIVAQWPVPVKAADTPETLAARVLEVEHQLLPAVVLTAARNGKVVRLPIPQAAFSATEAPAVTNTLVST